MAVKIRLARRGRKKLAMFDVVVAKATSPRDGRFIDKLGTYNPNTNPATILLDDVKAFDWIMKGAQPTDTVRAMLSYRGILLKKHLQVGVNKGAITQEEADAKFEEWKNQKESKITGKVETLAMKKEADKKARLDAEAKVKEARAEAIRKKNIVEEAPVAEEAPAAVAEEQAPEVVAEEASKAAEAVSEEAPETPTEEAPKAEESVAEATQAEAPEEEPLSEHAEQTPVAEAAKSTPAADEATDEKKEE